jgi:hypothetical protein
MFKKLLPLLFLFAGFQANATLIDNGSTTVDTATNLEWLDVTATLGESYNSVIGGFGGYIADGYSVATTSQLCVLFGALGDSIANCPDAGVDILAAANVAEFIYKFGDTTVSQPGYAGTFGWYDSGYTLVHGTVGMGCIEGSIFFIACAGTNAAWTDSGGLLIDSDSLLFGGWLVRDASVPEPAIIGLFTLGLVGIGFARRKRQS